MADEKPNYKVYRSRPRLPGRREEDGAAGVRELREPREAPQQPRREGPRPYQPEAPAPRRRFPFRLPRRVPGTRRRVTVGRVLRWLVVAVIFWLGLSAVLFIVSAQLQRGDLASRVGPELDPGPYPLFGANTILVLGSDARTKGLAEPGSQIGGPSRSDSIMLLRVGGGANASLSIPRDTVVDIPGSGTNKINAAYAIGGPALMIETIKQYLGIEVNHLVEIDFKGFPKFVDALGGVNMRFGHCIVSRFEGRTIHFRRGEHHLNGKQALDVVRVRKNRCEPSESDLTRARRQQQFLEAVKGKIVNPLTFPRWPLVGWRAPRAIVSDMGGLELMALYFDMETSGKLKPRILRPINPGANPLQVSDAERQAAVQRFLDG
jgi:LCP family protein required for cell wall assembly